MTAVTDAADVDREVMALIAVANAELLGRVLRGGEAVGGHQTLVALASARNLGAVVDDIVRALVGLARSEGQTWAEIGGALHVTRQAALQRFGGSAGEAAPVDEPTVPLRGAASKATKALELFLRREWEQMRADFDERMTRGCSTELLVSVRDTMAANLGAFARTGNPVVTTAQGYTIIDVPLVFDRGERSGRITFNGDGRIAGFFIRPALGEAGR